MVVMLNRWDHVRRPDVAGRGERGDAGSVIGHAKEPLSGPGLFQTVCAALLPGIDPAWSPDSMDSGLYLDGWGIHDMGCSTMGARVGISRPPAVCQHGSRPVVAMCCIADFANAASLWKPCPDPAMHTQSGGEWLLTYVHDTCRGVEWDVYCAPGGSTWRMMPRYAPAWLREREREVMACLRGTLPLPDGDPLVAASQAVPIALDGLFGTVHDQERERATITYVEGASGVAQAQPWYVVKLRWRKLSLRPYRSLGFWLVDGVTRLREGHAVL